MRAQGLLPWPEPPSSGLCVQARREGGRSQVFERAGSPRAKAETSQVLCRAERGVALPASPWSPRCRAGKTPLQGIFF